MAQALMSMLHALTFGVLGAFIRSKLLGLDNRANSPAVSDEQLMAVLKSMWERDQLGAQRNVHDIVEEEVKERNYETGVDTIIAILKESLDYLKHIGVDVNPVDTVQSLHKLLTSLASSTGSEYRERQTETLIFFKWGVLKTELSVWTKVDKGSCCDDFYFKLSGRQEYTFYGDIRRRDVLQHNVGGWNAPVSE